GAHGGLERGRIHGPCTGFERDQRGHAGVRAGRTGRVSAPRAAAVGHAGGGVLAGITVVEMDGLGPAPFCAMMLADLGADVIRVERPAPPERDPEKSRKRDTFGRGRRSIELDVKTDAGRETVARLAAEADVLIEGFRPGVMERLGLGPDVLCKANPRLV